MNPNDTEDPFMWLEDVHGERALDWVRERNAHSQQILCSRPEYEPIRARLLALLNSKERIPRLSRRGAHFYNLWQDDANPRGVWRRTTLDEYRRSEPAWEEVLDLDALGAAEGENWVWAGAIGLPPTHQRCLIALSRGGADACVIREFDTVAKAFVDDGFVLPEAKTDVEWIDADTLYVGTNFGPGTLTASGYPRLVKRWARGTPLAQAAPVFEVEAGDMAAHVSVDHTPGHRCTLFLRAIDFYRRHCFRLVDGQLLRLDVPDDASIDFWHGAGDPADTLLLELRSDLESNGRTYPAGALLAADAHAYLAGERRFDVLFEPSPTRSLAGYATTRTHVILNVLDNVAGRLVAWHRTAHGYESRDVDAPYPGTLSVQALFDPMLADDPLAEHYLLDYCDFLTPDTLSLGQSASDERETLKSLPQRFDASGMRSEQFFATSADGTRVPYFVVWPRRERSQPPDGGLPTLLYGYGGFEISMQPWYAAGHGSGWLERGGVLVVANIRGGGEFGPQWHQAALKAKRQRSFDDFIAVAEDLIARRITTPTRLGIEGGSNGGLLVGAALTQRPELFNAVVCSVPLLDMRRYHQLLAGASWMAEYGDPDDPAEWQYISKYSPYHALRSGVRYPAVLFTTSTRDDRVHPGHARKMAARMLALDQPVLYYENIEGGHGGAADNAQRAHVQALEISFLWCQLGGSPQSADPELRTDAPHRVADGSAEEPRAASRGLAGPAIPPEAQSVLDRWFGAPGSAEHGRPREFWFRKNDATDRELAERYAPLVERALRGELADWAGQPAAALAQILLLDQFTRNTLRETPRAFAGDRRALRAASAMVGARQDEALNPVERAFVYMPFEHAEGLAMQDESVRLFTRLAELAPELADMLDYAHRHREVIRRFGRFPHRNAILGRRSTAEEIAFLQQPGSHF